MHLLGHKCVRHKPAPGHPLANRVVYIPAMAEGSVEMFASVFRWLGFEARPTPASDDRTKELGAIHTNGDECYPLKVTVGDLIKITQEPDFDPDCTAYFMATGNGPCRFGQYASYTRRVLSELGCGNVLVFSPTGNRGYSDIGNLGTPFVRATWRALVCADILRKALLQTRPYETVRGSADRAFRDSVHDICETIESSCSDQRCQMKSLVDALKRSRSRFQTLPAIYDPQRPLIGVVGEIFCRLNNFSNEELVRRLESCGAECWMTDIAEWIEYSNGEEVLNLRLSGRSFSTEMFKSKLRSCVQHADLERLSEPFAQDFVGYEEPQINAVIERVHPYLRHPGCEGEMMLSVGKSAWLAEHGADGVVDISPFTCMNGIVSEAIYPKLSEDYGGIPIRNFYFDGTPSDLDEASTIFMELAKGYQRKKKYARRYPARFFERGGAEDCCSILTGEAPHV